METIDYSTRGDLVAALLEFRKQGVKVDVIGNGKTLRFPEGINSTPEDEEPEGDSLLGVVIPLAPAEQPAGEPATPPPPDDAGSPATTEGGETMRDGQTLDESLAQRDAELATTEGSGDEGLDGLKALEDEDMDRSTFTNEGTCSKCHEAAIADENGGWVHVESATHGDEEGQFVPNEPPASTTEDDDEDLIGAPATEPAKATKRPRKKA